MDASMYLGGHALCHLYGERNPILVLSGSGLDSMRLTTTAATAITRDELHAVQSLRAAVERFAAECERLASVQGVTA